METNRPRSGPERRGEGAEEEKQHPTTRGQHPFLPPSLLLCCHVERREGGREGKREGGGGHSCDCPTEHTGRHFAQDHAGVTGREGGRDGREGWEKREIDAALRKVVHVFTALLSSLPPSLPPSQAVGIVLFPFVLLGSATGKLGDALSSSSSSRPSSLASSPSFLEEGEEEDEEGMEVPPPSIQ